MENELDRTFEAFRIRLAERAAKPVVLKARIASTERGTEMARLVNLLASAHPGYITASVEYVNAEEESAEIPELSVARDEESPRIYWQGMPRGLELHALLDSLEHVASGRDGLSEESRTLVRDIESPIELLVFVKETCRFCPPMVVLANRLSLANPHVSARTVMAEDFPDFAGQFFLRGVPRVFVDRRRETEIRVSPEADFVRAVVRAAHGPVAN